MREKPTIRNLVALLLLAFFTISFIPKSFFHDVLASHTDAISCEHPENKTCVHQQGFKCSFHDLVVTAPYVSSNIAFTLLEPNAYSSYTNVYFTAALQHYFFGKESRGPPAIVI